MRNRAGLGSATAGLAVLVVSGMIATPAGAALTAVPAKPTMIRYEAFWVFPPARSPDVDKINGAANQRVFAPALADGGLRILSEDFMEERCEDLDAGTFERSWLLVSAVHRSQSLPGEVVCRVLRHERAWVLAGVLSPREEDDHDAWTENRRALAVLTSTLRIKG